MRLQDKYEKFLDKWQARLENEYVKNIEKGMNEYEALGIYQYGMDELQRFEIYDYREMLGL